MTLNIPGAMFHCFKKAKKSNSEQKQYIAEPKIRYQQLMYTSPCDALLQYW